MIQWEYLRKPFSDLAINNAIQIDLLNFLGKAGWEMVTITNWNGKPAFIYFKRQVRDLLPYK